MAVSLLSRNAFDMLLGIFLMLKRDLWKSEVLGLLKPSFMSLFCVCCVCCSCVRHVSFGVVSEVESTVLVFMKYLVAFVKIHCSIHILLCAQESYM